MLRPLTRLCLLIVGLAGICGVSYGQTVDETAALPRLAAEDPNGFVLEVQRQLSAAGYYNGSLSGILDRATIAGINSLCRHAGTIDDCQEGPLSPRGSEAVALALQSLVPATPVTTEVVAADETAEVPEQKAEVQKEAESGRSPPWA